MFALPEGLTCEEERICAELGPSPACLPGVVLLEDLSSEKFAVKHLVGFFGFGEACLQPHLEHLGVLVYVGSSGVLGSSMEKKVCFCRFCSETISLNRKSECLSSGLGWRSKC